jgi:ATP-dependent Clp protease adapter protein ClpS
MNQFRPDRPSVPQQLNGGESPGQPSSARRDRSLPRYKVILHHDPSVQLMVVIRSVMDLTRFPRAEATHKMWQAHHTGRSVILTTYLERAELYVEQFADRGLTTSIEPA